MSNNTIFSLQGLDEYIYWQTEDKRTLKKINRLPRQRKINSSISASSA